MLDADTVDRIAAALNEVLTAAVVELRPSFAKAAAAVDAGAIR
jgi:hypothetical protein